MTSCSVVAVTREAGHRVCLLRPQEAVIAAELTAWDSWLLPRIPIFLQSIRKMYLTQEKFIQGKKINNIFFAFQVKEKKKLGLKRLN